MNTDPREPNPRILSSWKEVANYLGKSLRTAQRYERECGLPVRRPAGKWHAAVFATKDEMEAWVKANPTREVHLPLNSNVNVEKMQKLCDEMTGLQAELRATLEELRDSLLSLRQTMWD